MHIRLHTRIECETFHFDTTIKKFIFTHEILSSCLVGQNLHVNATMGTKSQGPLARESAHK